MSKILYESGPLTVGEFATPRGSRLQIAIAGGEGVVQCERDDARELANVLRAWLEPPKPHMPPTQIAARFCRTCGHIYIAIDVGPLDRIQPVGCDDCEGETSVLPYRLEKGQLGKLSR